LHPTIVAPAPTSEAESNVREIPGRRGGPERHEHGEERSAGEGKRPAGVLAAVHHQQLDEDHAVDERAEDRVHQHARAVGAAADASHALAAIVDENTDVTMLV